MARSESYCCIAVSAKDSFLLPGDDTALDVAYAYMHSDRAKDDKGGVKWVALHMSLAEKRILVRSWSAAS